MTSRSTASRAFKRVVQAVGLGSPCAPCATDERAMLAPRRAAMASRLMSTSGRRGTPRGRRTVRARWSRLPACIRSPWKLPVNFLLSRGPMRVRFGQCTLDTGSRELLRSGAPVHLTGKAYRLLEVLIERRPEALSKDELQELVWPGVFVSEANLTSLVTE